MTAVNQERLARLDRMIREAWDIYQEALEIHTEGREIAATCVLFSGGNDSTTLAHLFRNVATHAIHANTGIGVEQTRQFVRDTCARWNLPLIEKHPPEAYDDLVIADGFPGPAKHWKMYTRLKERCLEAAKKDLLSNPRRQRVVFIAGRRRSESSRRADIAPHSRRRSHIWVAPFVNWTKLDLNTYRILNKVPRNEVSDLLHMSGECLCGAFAKPGELDEIGIWFPDVRDRIQELERKVTAAGHCEPLNRWGHGTSNMGKARPRSGPLCSSCDARFQGGVG